MRLVNQLFKVKGNYNRNIATAESPEHESLIMVQVTKY